MATPPKRLGRGLGSIIAGGTGQPQTDKSPIPPTPKKHKKELTEAPPLRTSGKESPQAPANITPEVAFGFREIPIELIDPSPYQMRREFDPTRLNELVESIRAEGLMQPITVRSRNNRFELIMGERRFRACKQLQLKTITARVIEAADASAAAQALIENLQREDLNPIDEALGYASLMEDFKLTQEAVSERIGKPRSNVANYLRLLRLNKECQGYVSKGMLTFGHARALLGLESQDQQTLLARRIIESGMSVRETESQVNRWKDNSGKTATKRKSPEPPSQNAVVKDIERRLTSHFNTTVQIKHTPKKGILSLEYYGNDDLQRILQKLGIET